MHFIPHVLYFFLTSLHNVVAQKTITVNRDENKTSEKPSSSGRMFLGLSFPLLNQITRLASRGDGSIVWCSRSGRAYPPRFPRVWGRHTFWEIYHIRGDCGEASVIDNRGNRLGLDPFFLLFWRPKVLALAVRD